MECLLNLPINTETGNQKSSSNKLCSITVRAIGEGWEGAEGYGG